MDDLSCVQIVDTLGGHIHEEAASLGREMDLDVEERLLVLAV